MFTTDMINTADTLWSKIEVGMGTRNSPSLWSGLGVGGSSSLIDNEVQAGWTTLKLTVPRRTPGRVAAGPECRLTQ
jgi:hypothetical protein